jgi:hypothetical protein
MANNFATLPCGEISSRTTKPAFPQGKNFKIDEHNSNEDRISYFFDQFGVVEVLMQTTTLSYRKAGRLKMIKAQKENELATTEIIIDPVILVEQHDVDKTATAQPSSLRAEDEQLTNQHDNDHIDVEIEDENHSVSDLMTTEDEDEPDDEQDDDDDDRPDDDGDDEPILGSWMESMLSPPETESDLESKIGNERDCNKGGVGEDKKTGNDDFKDLIEEFIREKDNDTMVSV